MLKWLLVLIVAVVVLSLFARRFQKLGLGRLPGDVRFRFRGEEYFVPITSTLLISALLTLIARFV
jgi:Protein of unknown function (DUF2905)